MAVKMGHRTECDVRCLGDDPPHLQDMIAVNPLGLSAATRHCIIA